MAETIKVLAQLSPAAATQTDLYTVPGSMTATISSLMVCNQNGSTIKFRARVRVAGAANDVKQFLYFDVEVLKNDAFAATLGITLGAGDVVSVQSDTANVSFNLFGVEVT